MRNWILPAIGFLALQCEAATYNELNNCRQKQSTEEKLRCFEDLTDKNEPPPPGEGEFVKAMPIHRVVVYGSLEPAFPESGVDVFEEPATISLSRENNRSSTDVRAAGVYHRYFGEYRNHALLAGVGWFRREDGEDRSDARSILLGADLFLGSGRTWFAM